MRWNCPHCQTGLEAPDHQLSSNWRFSLCPKCVRFGLIRAGAQGAVKVDRAPAGEGFLRASTVDSAGVSGPLVIPAQPRIRATAIPPEEISKTIITPTAAKIQLPEPLPEVPEKRAPIFPKLILAGCLLLLAWNGWR